MTKVFFVSLLLASIFLIVNAELSAAQCENYQDYQCAGSATAYGEIVHIEDTCVELCLDSQYPYYLDGYWFTGYLYPVTGSKSLLGTASSYFGWAGCSVEFHGRSMTTRLSYIDNDSGQVATLKCAPCDNCCHGE